MAQHDQVIDNGSGLTVRTDFNAAIAALFSSSSGPIEPSVTVPGQAWFDTGNAANPVLRIRNLANTGWLKMFEGGQAGIDISTGKRPAPPKDTFVWNDKLDMSGTDVMTLDDTGNLSIIGKATVNGLTSSGDVDLTGHKLLNAVIAQARQQNLVVNPAMAVSQENGSAIGTVNGTGYFAADQWFVYAGNGLACSAQQVAAGTPDRSYYRIRKTVTTPKASLAAGDLSCFQQPIEGNRILPLLFGFAQAQQAVLRFGFKGPAGTYSISVCNGAANRSYVKNFTITAGQANTDTLQTFVIPPDTTGTWTTDATVGAYLQIVDAVGATGQGTDGVWQAGNKTGTAANSNMVATNGNVVELFDVGFYPDPQQSGVAPPFIAPHYSDALATCMRYFQTMTGFLLSGYNIAGGFIYDQVSMMVPMRANPTSVFSNLANITNATNLVLGAQSPTVFVPAISCIAAGGATITFDGKFNARM
jgi:hypothetical protein